MIRTTVSHNDVVVTTILSTRFVDWGHLREIERIREEIYIDPKYIADSLTEIERRLTPNALKTLIDSGEHLIGLLRKGDPHLRGSLDLWRRSLPDLPYFSDEPLQSQCQTLEHMILNAFPWMLYLMITDPAL